MIQELKNKWKYSKARFYYKNLLWNVQFYIFSKKQFKDIEYTKGEEKFQYERVKRQRFIGYKFKDKIYLDNPGFLDIEPDVWTQWKTKKYF